MAEQDSTQDEPPAEDAVQKDQPSDPKRRQSMKAGIAVLGAGVAAGVGVPAVVAIHAPLVMTPIEAGGDFAPVGKVDDFTVGTPKSVEIRSQKRDAWSNLGQQVIGRAWVLKKEDNGFTVFSTVCPHLGCGVDYKSDVGKFTCPCHVSFFDLAGETLEGPSRRGLDPLQYEVRDDELFVRFERFELNIAERNPTAG